MTFTRRRLVQLWIALAMTTVGCGRKDSATTRASSESTALTESDRVALMERHYRAVIEAHDSVIAGDHRAARGLLLELSVQTLPERAPVGWKEPHRKMQEQAGAARGVDDLVGVGARVAAVVAACGGCHSALGRTPFGRAAAEPKEDESLGGAMQRHQWATERLWEGIAGPVDSAWRRGAAALAEGRVFAVEGGTVTEELRQQEDALRALGKAATTPEAERPALYGRLLAACAACHGSVGVSPKARAE